MFKEAYDPENDFYEILGLNPDSIVSMEDVDKAWNNYLKNHHPDLGTGNIDEDALNAYKTLRNRRLRDAYDVARKEFYVNKRRKEGEQQRRQQQESYRQRQENELRERKERERVVREQYERERGIRRRRAKATQRREQERRWQEARNRQIWERATKEKAVYFRTKAISLYCVGIALLLIFGIGFNSLISSRYNKLAKYTAVGRQTKGTYLLKDKNSQPGTTYINSRISRKLNKQNVFVPDNNKIIRKLSNTEISIYYNEAKKYMLDGSYEKAISSLIKIIENNPDDEVAYNNWGCVLLKQEKYADAMGKFQKALKINPTYSNALINICNTYIRQKKFKEASVLAEYISSIDPFNPNVYYIWGFSLQRIGRNEDALKKYKKVIELDGNHSKAFYSIGMLLMRMGNVYEAQASLEIACKLGMPIACKS